MQGGLQEATATPAAGKEKTWGLFESWCSKKRPPPPPAPKELECGSLSMGHWWNGAGAMGAQRQSLQSWESGLWGGGASWMVVISLKGIMRPVGRVEKTCDLQSRVAANKC